MIKAVVFDMGGVILNLDIDRSIRAFKERAGFADIENYLNAFHQQGFIGEFEAGRITMDEFYSDMESHCRPGISREEITACFNELLVGLDSEMLGFVRELSGRFDLYILSNNNPISRGVFQRMMADAGMELGTMFRGCFFSYEMKMLKPGREIFEKAIAGIGASPDEIVFIDDSDRNIEGAKAVGLKTILYRKGMDIRAALRGITG